MESIKHNPTDPEFVQNPYPFYDRMRERGPLFYWEEYGRVCAVSYEAVHTLLKDRRLGREAPAEFAPKVPEHLAPFYEVEAHSMLELEAPRHTRLRGLVLRAFTSRRIAALAPEIDELADRLIDQFPSEPFDLLEHYAQRIPVLIICRLLGVPEERADDLLMWSNAMVAMYQANRTPEIEAKAVNATQDFVAFMRGYVETRRDSPADDLISELIAAEEDGEKLTTDELITTCILLLNAGHEATAHSLGNALKIVLEQGDIPINTQSVEEFLRFDPPLHIFSRWVYEDFELFGHHFKRGDEVNCVLAAANRDPNAYDNPNDFIADRKGPKNAAFGGGIHFCVGAPLARLEMVHGLQRIFERCPNLKLAEPAEFADVYHFHGLKRLMVNA